MKTFADIEFRLAAIDSRLDWMWDNYSGCDWCCGGGDEEVTELMFERDNLLSMLKPAKSLEAVRSELAARGIHVTVAMLEAAEIEAAA